VRGLVGDDVFAVANLATTDITQVVFRGGASNDSLNGAASQTSIIAFGEDGNDTIVGGLGNDVFDGGTGVDTIVYTGDVDTVQIELADVVSAPSASARATFGAGSLVLDFGAGNILSLEWLPGAFTAQQYYSTYLQNVVLV
jgi:Ca2+-binding RTX toxin-like protein